VGEPEAHEHRVESSVGHPHKDNGRRPPDATSASTSDIVT
jgi:hypothetical protein